MVDNRILQMRVNNICIVKDISLTHVWGCVHREKLPLYFSEQGYTKSKAPGFVFQV